MRTRQFLTTITRQYSTSYLTEGLVGTSRTSTNKPRANSVKTERLPPKSVESLIITPKELTNRFRTIPLDPKVVNVSQKLFNSCKPRLAWTLANYNEIPDVKDPRKHAIPEVLFLGHTNSGKSSLINNLLVTRQEGKTSGATTEHAYVSNHAGYTKTMNCYNISNKFNLIDSPGYGMFGEEKQGEMVVEYLERRRVLRRVFLLIDSTVGYRDEDLQLLELLQSEGQSYEIVFTKVDMVITKIMKQHGIDCKRTNDVRKREANYAAVQEANQAVERYFEKMERPLGLSPRFLFNNAVCNKYVSRRYGYKEIRGTIVESVGGK